MTRQGTGPVPAGTARNQKSAHVEEALRQSEERYRHLLEAVTDYVFSVRVENGVPAGTIHGPGCEAVTGYSPTDFMNDPGLWLRMVIAEDRPVVTGQAGRLLAGEHPPPVEHRIIRKDGEVRWVSNTLVPQADTAGNLSGYDGLIKDITPRKVVELAFAKSEAQLDAIIRASPIPMFVIDNRHRVISWNRALEKSTGIRARDVLGTNRHWMAFYDHERPCLSDLLVEGAEAKIPEMYGGKFRRSETADGAYEATDHFPRMGTAGRWLHFIAAPIADTSGVLIGAVETLEDITDLVEAQAELKESEERYSALFSNNYSVSLLIDPDSGRIVDANDAAVRYYGYPRDTLLSMGIYDLNRLPRERVVRNLVRAKDEKAKHFSSVHYRADGERRYVEVYSGPIRVQGRPLFYSIIHDISDRRRAEQALRESEERYSALFSNSNSVTLLIDPDSGRIVDANDAAERYYGYPRETLLSMGIYDLNRLPRNRVVRNLVRAKDEKAKHFQSVHYRADGERRYVEVYSGPIRVQGRPLFYSIIHDITDSRLAVEALRESEERYRTLIEQLPDYVIVHRNGLLLYVNPAGAATMNYDPKALLGKPIFDLIAPESHEITRQAVLRRMKGEDVQPYEIRIAARDGTFHSVLVHGALIQYEGAPASINVLTDITPLKKADEAIRRANEDLEKRVRERTEELSRANELLLSEIAARKNAEQEITRSLDEKVLLLREIHHRVKNNLQIIASLLKLQSRYITDQKVLESIQDSQSRVRAMALVHERIYRSHNISDINLREYLNYLTRQISQFYHTRQFPVTMSVEMEDLVANIDTVIPIGLIMNELISNSLKHAFPDSRKGTIRIQCTAQEPDILRFIYHDSGVGMPRGLDWKTTESLGLRLINNLVDQLDGSIELEEGEGTTFSIMVHRKQDYSDT